MKLNLIIQNAVISEMPAAFGMLKDAALWLQKQKNSNQWRHWLDPDEHLFDWVRAGFENNEFFFARHESELAGMFRLTCDRDDFWKDKSDASGYLHAFTTVRKFSGQGAGTEMLNWMKDYCRASGRLILRLDCVSKAAGLKVYYERNGFKFVSEVNTNNGLQTRYEMAL
jgi:GNAT superfamily N-acetyltransferase